MGFASIGRGIFGGKVFGNKNIVGAAPQSRGSFRSRSDGNALDRLMADCEQMFASKGESTYRRSPADFAWELVRDMAPEERGELLVAAALEEYGSDRSYSDMTPREQLAMKVRDDVLRHDIEVKAEDLGTLLSFLTGIKDFRTRPYHDEKFATMLGLINSAIKQGAYLSSGDCADLAAMAAEIRSSKSYYRAKADKKKLFDRAEKLEKLAGAEVSATELLMQRCEGAENQWEFSAGERPNAQFWADLLAETAATLDQIRRDTKGSAKPDWGKTANAFTDRWPDCGEVQPDFAQWKASGQPVAALKEHNGKRSGWAKPAAYRDLPDAIDGAVAHSRYHWGTDQIPGLDVLADLENPAWTALVEQLITQRRSPRATKAWNKETAGLAKAVGLEEVEERVHAWLELFHTPALGREGYTKVCNGERFVRAIEELEKTHPDWPQKHADDIPALGRAIGIVVASGGGAEGTELSFVLRPGLVRFDDPGYKGNTVTTGVLNMPNPSYTAANGRSHYGGLGGWLRLSVENEDFLRGVVWLTALLPDRARAIDGLEKTALSAGTYMWFGDDGMRSKVIANAAIATLIGMGGDDIGHSVLRLSSKIEHRSVQAPLVKHLNDSRSSGSAQ